LNCLNSYIRKLLLLSALVCAISVSAQTLVVGAATPLIAGQNIAIGEVRCQFEPNSIVNGSCTATATNGWCMPVGHMYLGTSVPASMAPGRFPFKLEPTSCVTELTIPFKSVPVCESGNTVILAFHVEARAGGRQETAWAQGAPSGFNWSMVNTLLCPFDT
jgi:hypothetical protein